MPKFKYIATFADGSIATRTSDHEYAVAWQASYRRAIWDTKAPYALLEITDEVRTVSGFSKDVDSVSAFRPVMPIPRGASSSWKAAQRKKNEELLTAIGYKVEIVKAVKS